MSKPSPDIGVLVVTHGQLGAELVQAARIIVGNEKDVPLSALSVGWDVSVDTAREQVREAIEHGDRGRGVLILTDMFGGTPTNLCLSFLAPERVEIITGVNLPMVVKTVNLAGEGDGKRSLREVAERVAARGAESVMVPSRMLEPGGPS